MVQIAGAGNGEMVPVAGTLTAQPAVGDWVGFDGIRVAELLPRRNQLAREETVLAANVDRGLVLTPVYGKLDPRMIERFVALVAEAGIEAILVLTKEDAGTDVEIHRERLSRELGVEVLLVSSREGWGVEELEAKLTPRSTTVLVGVSGVGKSTLLNALIGEERQRTLPVRERDDSGQHATVHRELFALPNGALLIDIPGMRMPALASAAGVADTFADVLELAEHCRFNDCTHRNEPGCAVRGVIPEERLESMRALEREGAAAAERRSRRRR